MSMCFYPVKIIKNTGPWTIFLTAVSLTFVLAFNFHFYYTTVFNFAESQKINISVVDELKKCLKQPRVKEKRKKMFSK